MTVEVYSTARCRRRSRSRRRTCSLRQQVRARRRRRRRPASTRSSSSKKGTGPLYYNAYLTNFTLEDFITKAGLEIKVNRKYYKLVKADKSIKAAGSRGQAVDQKVEKYERAGVAEPGRRSRAATWSRSNWRSTARTTTSTWSSRT